jgi:hypothetical protein
MNNYSEWTENEIRHYIVKMAKEKKDINDYLEYMVAKGASTGEILAIRDVFDSLCLEDKEDLEEFFNKIAYGFNEKNYIFLKQKVDETVESDELRRIYREIIAINLHALEKTVKIFWELSKNEKLVKILLEKKSEQQCFSEMLNCIAMTKTPFSYDHLGEEREKFDDFLKILFCKEKKNEEENIKKEQVNIEKNHNENKSNEEMGIVLLVLTKNARKTLIKKGLPLKNLEKCKLPTMSSKDDWMIIDLDKAIENLLKGHPKKWIDLSHMIKNKNLNVPSLFSHAVGSFTKVLFIG